ncbi:MAG TPA: DUF1761 domain-containing protein [Bacteroidetes bacterium]|nr:DUF1761 domain-containing protein [Bacteroidota bacterium]
MEPIIELNYVAILIAVVANFFLGFIWYTPLFGKLWAKELGLKVDEKPGSGVLIKGMAIMVIGNFLMAWVFAHNIAVWHPATWGQPTPEGMEPTAMALMASIFTWLGFYLPGDLSRMAWENNSWKLFFINTVYHFLTLLVAAMIITNMP